MSNCASDCTLPVSDSKHFNMKQFINNVRNYLQTKAEDSANAINRHLQLLSVTIDLSIFDPHTNIVSEFFVCLHDLLSSVEQRSALTWCCVNVLSVACRNPAARNALIHTYQFLPLLSRLLGDQLTTEKKIRLLNLMQELTCGIKISWQIPHLPHLMSILTRWVEKEDEEVVTLSLGVLVNLCYKNLPAVYTLSRCVDIKKFVRTCMPLKGLKVEVHVCKLLIILDYMNGKVPEGAFLKLIEVTFKSLYEAFKARDAVLLRHIVEFFLDMWKQNSHSDSLLNFNKYNDEIEKLLQEVENSVECGSGDITTDQDSECMALLFEFLHFLIELKLEKIEFYPRIVNVALKWIKTDLVCSEALAVLRTIALNITVNSNKILEPILTGLPIFLLTIENEKEGVSTHIKNNKRLGALMELLRALVKSDSTRSKVLDVLKKDLVSKIFVPLIGDQVHNNRASDANTYAMEAIILYVNTIALIDEIAKHNMEWIQLYTNMMQQKQIHMVLAQGLLKGPKDTKALVMQLGCTHIFPLNEVASVMCELQPLVDTGIGNGCTQQMADNLCFPIMSVTQLERLDEVMDKLKQAYEQNTLVNVSTSDVMELYEYKLATMSHAERAAIASVEAASQRCTHLQHRTAQLTAELSRLHQLLLHTQQCHEEATKIKKSVIEENKQLQEWVDRCNSQMAAKEKLLSEKMHLLEETTKRLKETDNARNNLEEKYGDLKQIVGTLEENLVKKEKLVEKKEEQICRMNMNIEHFKLQISQLEKQVKHTEAELASKTKECSDKTKELQTCKQILGTITELTSSQYSK